MEKAENLAHWERWAQNYGTDIRATTKCLSIKRLEVDAFSRQLTSRVLAPDPVVLEIGCGNGFNGFSLAEAFPGLRYVGVDFSPSMVEQAAKIMDRQSQAREFPVQRLAFGVLDARNLSAPFQIDDKSVHRVGELVRPLLPVRGFDVVLTNRMLINLVSAEEQLAVMRRIAGVLAPGGLFLMLENEREAHSRLNQIRQSLGLPNREAASYNVFIDSGGVVEPFKNHMDLLETEAVSSLHDLLLYAVAPAAANREVEYDTPLMKTLTDAILCLKKNGMDHPEGYGQNVLWVWRKK